MKFEVTRLDRAIAIVSPGMALRRVQARAAMSVVSGYSGARRDRGATARWTTLAASADADTLPDLDTLRARSRDLVRNDPIAASAVSTKVTNVVGPGHLVRPDINAGLLGLDADQKKAWEEQALAIWQEWAEGRNCDITRTQNFAEMEDTVYRGRLETGDIFSIRRYRERPGSLLGTCCQLVEGDRCSNPHFWADRPGLAGGIESDRDGAPIAYHFADRHSLDLMTSGAHEWRRVPAFTRNGRRIVLHIHGSRPRPDMTRYAPMLAPVIESLKQRSRYSEAELMAAVVSACFAIGMKSPDGQLGAGLTAPEGNGSGAAGSQQADIRFTEPGIIYDLADNEEVMNFEPGRPNPAYEPFVTQVAREVGAGTDVPYELLLKHFQASYSASRAALEMAWQGFRVERSRHVSQFCQPTYEDVISEAVARGLLEAPGFFTAPLMRRAWLTATWMGPARLTIDPVKDANADKTYLEMGVQTRTRICAERFGQDYQTVRARREEEDREAGTSGTEETSNAD
ncbi:phage portal protein [Roseovarius indicus]|uniref:phage portal protein n=1 Tax=Roseovarius indicus TaxID=540747 RepID=UPI0007D978C7|nr:phage portal protein [Roseovarius indicus]OAO02706.1 phage portal protein [Roseovarius indicus]